MGEGVRGGGGWVWGVVVLGMVEGDVEWGGNGLQMVEVGEVGRVEEAEERICGG